MLNHEKRLDDKLFDALIGEAVCRNAERETIAYPSDADLQKMYILSENFDRQMKKKIRQEKNHHWAQSFFGSLGRVAVVVLAISGAAFGIMMTSEAVRTSVIETVQQQFAPQEKIVWTDSHFEAAVRVALNKPEGDIYYYEAETITTLNATEYVTGYSGIRTLDDLQYLPNLTHLNVSGNRIEDLTPISNLSKLTFLSLSDNRVKDLTPLSSLTQLTFLNIGENDVTDVTPLSSLTQLQKLGIARNNISDISVLSHLTNLNELYMETNVIVDISSVGYMQKLQKINIESNNIIDISVLGKLKKLDDVKVAGNPISDPGVLDAMPPGVVISR